VADFIGAGVAFPLRLGAGGVFALVRGEQEIAASVRVILGTAYGDRPMRPDFGCAIHDMVFDPVDAAFAGVVAAEVHSSLVRWEPRIDVREVVVDGDPDDPARVWITVTWSQRGENDPRNLVYPFYAIPGE